MKYELEKKLLDAGLKTFNRNTWYEIIDAMIDDFQKLIGCNFERDSKDDIRLEIDDPLRVSTTITLWTSEKEKQKNFTPTQTWLDIVNNNLLKIENIKDRSLIKWYGCIWGDMDEQPEEFKYRSFRNLFYADSTLFLFDPATEKRLCLETGESLVDFHFQRNPNGGSKWISLGWQDDIYSEWEHLDSWE